MGSAKDIIDLGRYNLEGEGFFFLKRYSVYDWVDEKRKMREEILHKDTASCLLTAYLFEKSEDAGIPTHYEGLIKNGKVVKFDELNEPTNVMKIKKFDVIKPKFEDGKYDYSVFTGDLADFIVPLEIISRYFLPKGSSIFGRLKRGEITIEDLGLNHYPEPGEELPKPFLDVSTKFEEEDRYINWDEAQRIAGLTEGEVKEIKGNLKKVTNLITKEAEKAGLVYEDGKIEVAGIYIPPRKYHLLKRGFPIADEIGGLDSCRYNYKGIPFSKQVLRDFHKTTSWYSDVEKAKELANIKGIKNWRDLCSSSPQELDLELKSIVSDMYTSVTDGITGRNFFDAPRVGEVAKRYKEWLESHQV